ncbi:unnamed protein product, partial [Prorocentrum cordatum]
TIANVWNASHRKWHLMGKLPCRFGCTGQHGRLFQTTSSAQSGAIALRQLQYSRPCAALSRVGLLGPAIEIDEVVFDIAMCYCAYSGAADHPPMDTFGFCLFGVFVGVFCRVVGLQRGESRICRLGLQ